MKLQKLKPVHKPKKKKRVGRGGKRGTYGGRGIKGQKARAGRRLKPATRQFVKRYPKLRGYKFRPSSLKPVVVNVGVLEKKFKSGEVVSPQTLLRKKIIRKIKGKVPTVKILGKGELTKALTIEHCLVSKSARKKIEKANGVVK